MPAAELASPSAKSDQSGASEIQHMQKALQQMNLHLHHVVSDITGVTGLRIIDAILAGQRDPDNWPNCATSGLQEHPRRWKPP